METRNQPNRFFTDKLITTFVVLGRKRSIRISELARDVNVTQCHLHKWIIPMLKSWECIIDQKDGWRRTISLSTRGQEVYKRLEEIGEILEDEINNLSSVQKDGSEMTTVKNVLIPFRYPGGKFYALKILEKFWKSVNHDEYREPFVGGGSVFFAKHKSKFNWLNDLHEDLIITYKVMADPILRRRLIELLSLETASKQRHAEVLGMKPKNEFEVAFRYFYLNRTSFSGKMKTPSWGYRPKRSLPPERWKERISPCGKKLEDVKLTAIDFEKVIKSPPIGRNILFFLDPPYFHAKQESHYARPFSENDHNRLCKLLKDIEHPFFLTYDDAREIREMYNWAYLYPMKFFYRLDNSQHSNGRRKIGSELVITNFKLRNDIQQKLDNTILVKVGGDNNGSK